MAFKVTRSISIDRPIDDVFATLTNVENTAIWFPAKVKESWTSVPPHGLGSTRHAEITIGWFRSQNDAVVTEYEPPRHAVMKGTSKSAPFEATLNFERAMAGHGWRQPPSCSCAARQDCLVRCSFAGLAAAGSGA
jgi:hypothetical protein